MKNPIYIRAIIPFIILSTLALILGEIYIYYSTKNYKEAIQSEVTLLLQTKKEETGAIAQSFAIDQPKLREIMRTKNYKALYEPQLFTLPKRYTSFKHLAIHIVDAQGINRYLSWTKKSVGKSVISYRPDLAQLLKKPRYTTNISVGKFDITFKGIAPIYDKKHNFLGLIEIITHLNSIAKKLQQQNIESAIIIDKHYNKQLTFPFSPHIIDGYHISNLDLDNTVKNFLQEKGVPYLLSKNAPSYIFRDDALLDGYFFINVPILTQHKQHIASYLLFIKDIYHLKATTYLMYLLFVLDAFLYLYFVYLLTQEKKKNRQLIETLDEQVRQKTQENLLLVYNDPLTGAYKKAKFELDRKNKNNCMIVLFNIKNFSKINEAYGFKVGDELLITLVKKVKSLLKNPIYRINADEFLFFSEDVDEDIDQLQNMLFKTIFSLKDETIQVRISLAFAVNPNEKEALRKLSIAIKTAKQKPFEKYAIYTRKNFNHDFLHYNDLLYDALYNQKKAKIVPYFQGIYNNETNKIIKYEALARLIYDDEVYSPYYFIPIAKDSGFLHMLTQLMIEKVFAYLATQPQEITCSINITEDDLQSHSVEKMLLEAAQKYNIETSRIIIEILEGVTSTGAKNNILQLQGIKQAGFRLAIDDFGVEYSNFERIQELDVDYIKIDAKYIKSIHVNQKSYQIVKAITSFADSMGIMVIAEYVENAAIQEKVKELGINFSQGYYFSEPTLTIE